MAFKINEVLIKNSIPLVDDRGKVRKLNLSKLSIKDRKTLKYLFSKKIDKNPKNQFLEAAEQKEAYKILEPYVKKDNKLTPDEIADIRLRYFPKMTGEIKELIDKLDDSPDWTLEQFERMGRSAAPAVPYIAKYLKSDDPYTRAHAAKTLGSIGKYADSAVKDIVKAVILDLFKVEDESISNRKECAEALASEIEALGKIGVVNKVIVSTLMDIDSNKFPYYNVTTAREKAFKSFGKKAVPYLREYLKYGNPDCISAVYFLGIIGAPSAEAVPDILKLALHGNRDLNVQIGFALKDIGKPAVPYLRKNLKSKEWRIREAAADGLGNIGKDAVGAFEDVRELLLNDKVGAVRKHCAYALAQMGKRAILKASADLKQALNDDDARVREWAVHALGEIIKDRNDVFSALVKLLKKESNSRVYSAIIITLGDSDSSKALPYIKEALESDDPAVIMSALRAVEKLGKTAEPLIPCLEKIIKEKGDEYGNIKAEAKEAIKTIKNNH
ncbi:MAG: HEAT repeat domain-containing protein [Armatimonadota bacterium]